MSKTLLLLIGVLLLSNSCRSNSWMIRRAPGAQPQTPEPLPTVTLTPRAVQLPAEYGWKSFEQMQADINAVLLAGYTKLCLFDLPRLWGYPDSRLIALLKKHANNGLHIAVFVQDVNADAATLEAVRAIGANTVMLYDKDLLALFKNAGLQTLWWSGVAYPPNTRERPQYLGWLDLRRTDVRQAVAAWTVQIPPDIDGLSLDYIRWNELGDGRSADQVTDLLQRIRAQWNSAGHGALAAAVRPSLSDKPGERDALAVGQNWNQWLNTGLLDYVYPMAYDSAKIPALVNEWRGYQNKIVPCLTDYERKY